MKFQDILLEITTFLHLSLAQMSHQDPIRMWNSLDEGLNNLPTITSFKHQLQSTVFPKIQVPSYFAWRNRYMSVLHARLKNNCSNLNNDLLINHLRKRPFCSWFNVTVDAKHSLLVISAEMSVFYFSKQFENSNRLT